MLQSMISLRSYALATCSLVVLTAVASPSDAVFAAELSLPKVSASSGETVVGSVKYRAQKAAVSTLQFDLAFDKAAAEKHLAITYSIGDATTAAGKTVASNEIAPGVIRFLIYGLNQTSLGDGSLVDLAIDVWDEFAPDEFGLHIFNVVCASPQGEYVPCRAIDGQVDVKK